jgi:hypothetical protein
MVPLPKPMAMDGGTPTRSLSMIVEYEVCRRASLCSWNLLVFYVYYQRCTHVLLIQRLCGCAT